MGDFFASPRRGLLDLEAALKGAPLCKVQGAKSFIGSCCKPFLTKHLGDFEAAGLPGIIVDIDEESCYELGRARDALAGDFSGQVRLRRHIIEKIISNPATGAGIAAAVISGELAGRYAAEAAAKGEPGLIKGNEDEVRIAFAYERRLELRRALDSAADIASFNHILMQGFLSCQANGEATPHLHKNPFHSRQHRYRSPK